MRSLEETLQRNKQVRIIGFNDVPFNISESPSMSVNIAGIICGDTRFEGMLWGYRQL